MCVCEREILKAFECSESSDLQFTLLSLYLSQQKPSRTPTFAVGFRIKDESGCVVPQVPVALLYLLLDLLTRTPTFAVGFR